MITTQNKQFADKAIQLIMTGSDPRLNPKANTDYMQYILNWTRINDRKLSHDQFMKICEYIISHNNIAYKNMVRKLNKQPK